MHKNTHADSQVPLLWTTYGVFNRPPFLPSNPWDLLPAKQGVSSCPVLASPLFWRWRSEECDCCADCTAGWPPAPTLSQKKQLLPWTLLKQHPDGNTQTHIHNNIWIFGSDELLQLNTENRKQSGPAESSATTRSDSFWHLHMEYQYFTWLLTLSCYTGCRHDTHPPRVILTTITDILWEIMAFMNPEPHTP